MKIIKSSANIPIQAKMWAISDAIVEVMENESDYDPEEHLDLIDTAARQLVKLCKIIDMDSIRCHLESEPMDVEASEFSITLNSSRDSYYVFLVYEEDKVYIDETPPIYIEYDLIDK